MFAEKMCVNFLSPTTGLQMVTHIFNTTVWDLNVLVEVSIL